MLRASSLRTVPARVHCRGRPAAAPFLHPLSLDGGEPCEDGQPQIPVTLELRTGDERADSLTEPTSSFYVALHTGETQVVLHFNAVHPPVVAAFMNNRLCVVAHEPHTTEPGA